MTSSPRYERVKEWLHHHAMKGLKIDFITTLYCIFSNYWDLNTPYFLGFGVSELGIGCWSFSRLRGTSCRRLLSFQAQRSSGKNKRHVEWSRHLCPIWSYYNARIVCASSDCPDHIFLPVWLVHILHDLVFNRVCIAFIRNIYGSGRTGRKDWRYWAHL